MTKPLLFVGLDYEKPSLVAEFAEELSQVDGEYGFKLNLDFFMKTALSGDIKPLERVLALGKPIFADLKMWNGKRTMVSVAEGMVDRGINYFNVYGLADKPFLEAVVKATKGSNTKVLGVTVLTHYTEEYCQRNFGCSFGEAVERFAKVNYDSGCHGNILPGTMLNTEKIKGIPIEKLVPAVRPEWYGKTGDNFQEQESFIKEAIQGGADLLVCSSPIRKSEDRKVALVKTLDEIERYS